jgi:GH18 family chitinase
MKKILINLLIGLTAYCISNIALAGKPFCAKKKENHQLIIGYLGADSSWALKNTDQAKLGEQLTKVSLINYSFIRLGKDNNGNTILAPTTQDIENIQLLQQLKPDLPIMIAVGGWGEREGFTSFVDDKAKRAIFIKSVQDLLGQYHLDGIDVDWENELLASEQEIAGVATLLQELYETVGNDGYCITNAVPGTQAYWVQYPNAKSWQAYVNWTTVMAYDNYGTFGPRTEHGSSLYEPNRKNDETYPYPTTSGDEAVKHYAQQGLPSHKIILGLPFYCHSYYIKNSVIAADEPGLHAPVLDPNISSQMSYTDAYNTYGDKLHTYKMELGDEAFQAASFYGVIPVEHTEISRFMSCEAPQSILHKIAYVEGNKLGGVSFWSLQQDLDFSHPKSLLHAIHDGFTQNNS